MKFFEDWRFGEGGSSVVLGILWAPDGIGVDLKLFGLGSYKLKHFMKEDSEPFKHQNSNDIY